MWVAWGGALLETSFFVFGLSLGYRSGAHRGLQGDRPVAWEKVSDVSVGYGRSRVLRKSRQQLHHSYLVSIIVVGGGTLVAPLTVTVGDTIVSSMGCRWADGPAIGWEEVSTGDLDGAAVVLRCFIRRPYWLDGRVAGSTVVERNGSYWTYL